MGTLMYQPAVAVTCIRGYALQFVADVLKQDKEAPNNKWRLAGFSVHQATLAILVCGGRAFGCARSNECVLVAYSDTHCLWMFCLTASPWGRLRKCPR